MKSFIIAAFMLLTLGASAQISSATLQASGLTCSMCSNAINKALQTLPFVETIKANIKESTFDIKFKAGVDINFDAIKDKVEGAGFFVADLYTQINVGDKKITKDEHLKVSGMNFHFLNTTATNADGKYVIHFADKGFLPAKNYKKNKKLTTMACYDTGKAANCCSKDGISAGERIYHVTV